MASRTPVVPDIQIDVLPRDYERALGNFNNEIWHDHSDGPTRWNDAPIWTLAKGTTERAFWSMKAFEGDRVLEEQAQRAMSQLVASLVCGRSFRSEGDLVEEASQLVTEQFGQTLTTDQYARVVNAARELWVIGKRSKVLTFSITEKGKKALAECWDCFECAAPNDVLCSSCRSQHVAPNRSAECVS